MSKVSASSQCNSNTEQRKVRRKSKKEKERKKEEGEVVVVYSCIHKKQNLPRKKSQFMHAVAAAAI